MRGGTYQGGYLTNYSGSLDLLLAGDTNSPITIQPYRNEKPVIGVGLDSASQAGQILAIDGQFTILRDVEITNPSTNRYSWAKYAAGVSLYGPYNKLINCIVHDTGEGLWIGLGAHQSEVYGCVVFNNGLQNMSLTNSDGTAREPDTRGHGHGFYARSEQPTTFLAENIVFNGFDLGFQCYTTSSSQPINGIRLEGNITFGNGRNSFSGDGANNILVYGGGLVDNLLVYTNFAYAIGYSCGENTRFGAGSRSGDTAKSSGTGVITGNHFFGSYNYFNCFTNLVWTNNFVAGDQTIVELTFATPNFGSTQPLTGCVYDWNHNVYDMTWSWPFMFTTNSYHYNFQQWTNASGFDVNSLFASALPTAGIEVYVRTNKYDENRANIVVVNWPMSNTVNVDLTGVLSINDAFTIVNAQNPLGAPVLQGKYSGLPVSLPSTGVSVARATGSPTVPTETGPLFNAFIVRRYSGTLNPPGILHVIH